MPRGATLAGQEPQEAERRQWLQSPAEHSQPPKPELARPLVASRSPAPSPRGTHWKLGMQDRELWGHLAGTGNIQHIFSQRGPAIRGSFLPLSKAACRWARSSSDCGDNVQTAGFMWPWLQATWVKHSVQVQSMFQCLCTSA